MSTSYISAQPSPGTVLWTYDLGQQIVCSPAVAPDGTVYIGSTAGLYAITNAGANASNKWTFSAAPPADFSCSPSIGSDGTIYFVGGFSNALFAVNPDGTQKWLFFAGGGGGTPAIGLDNTVYFQAYTGLYAITPAGDMKWHQIVGGSGHFTSPVLGPSGTIYLLSQQSGKLYALEPSGIQKWVRDLPGSPAGLPAIGSGGIIYASEGTLYAFAPDGTNLWTLDSELGLDGPPVTDKGGIIYVSANGSHRLYAINPSGAVAWQSLESASAGLPSTAAAIDAAGNIHYCVSNSIVALNPQGQILWSVFGGYNGGYFTLCVTSPTIAPDGTLFAAIGSKLYAIATGTNGPANSSWPMFQQNARHTGKIEKPSVNQPQKRSDNNFQFQLYAQLGQIQTVQTSTDLTAWTWLANVAITNVPMDVVDLSASNFLSRFYRVYSP